jgi:hypothetical protein
VRPALDFEHTPNRLPRKEPGHEDRPVEARLTFQPGASRHIMEGANDVQIRRFDLLEIPKTKETR